MSEEGKGEGFAKFVQVTRKNLRQKEVTLSMVDGKFAKNEITLHLTGLDPDYDIAEAVRETADGLSTMQGRNPIIVIAAGKVPAKIADKSKEDAEA